MTTDTHPDVRVEPDGDVRVEWNARIVCVANANAAVTCRSETGNAMSVEAIRIEYETLSTGEWSFTLAKVRGHYRHDDITTDLVQNRDFHPTQPLPEWLHEVIRQHVPGDRTPTDRDDILARLIRLDDDTLSAVNRALRTTVDNLRDVGGLGLEAEPVVQIGQVRTILRDALSQSKRDRRDADRYVGQGSAARVPS